MMYSGVARKRHMKVGYFVCEEGSKAVGEIPGVQQGNGE